MMNVAIVTNFFYEDHLGGTEKYCFELIKSLQQKKVNVSWLMPNFDSETQIKGITSDLITYVKFAAKKTGADNSAFIVQSFLSTLESLDINIVHFHELGGPEGSSALLLKAAAQQNYDCYVTYHLAYYTCLSGDLRYLNKTKCNGLITIDGCTKCIISHKMPQNLSVFSRLTELLPKTFWDKFTVTNLSVSKKIEELRIVERCTKKIIVLTDWYKDVLIINGVLPTSISVVKQAFTSIKQLDTNKTVKKNYCYIGRIQKDKGIFDIIKAFKTKELQHINIDIYGSNHSGSSFTNEIKGCKNITYSGFLAPDNVIATLKRYKALLIPSIVAEMAPLTFLEAYNAGTPVVVSDVPGNIEMLNQYGNGLSFAAGNYKALGQVIAMVENHEIKFSEKNVFSLNSFDKVAEEVLNIYSACFTKKQALFK